MLYFVEHVILVYLDDDGVLTLVVAALGEQLLSHLGGRAAKAHLVQLCHVVAQAHAALRVRVDEELHQLHYALRRFVEREGARVAAAELFQQTAALGILAREEAIEHEA